MKKVAINGLGRIGRLVLRHLMKVPHVRVVAVNDLTDAATLAHLMKYDSVHGPADFPVASDGNYLVLDGRRIRVYAEKDPQLIPFGAQGAQVVLECTGKFTKRAQAAVHLQGSVSHVIISAPSGDADRTIVMGVNEATLDPANEHVISNASCTTNCLGPLVKVMDEAFGIDYGFMTTVHSYTNDQRVLDLPHKDLRRARAAALSMIPTSTGAAKAIGLVLPHLKGRMDGLAVRVPTPDVSIVDLTATLKSDATLEAVQEAYRQAAETGPLAPYLEVLDAELVSADLRGRTASTLYDPYLTKVLGPRLVKVFAWYDNEFGYAARLKDLCVHLLERL
ncbi:MAG TPA: type I glyceraldehyde-3-phosphate dehydrogenase [Geothrix sp.]|uniref:type I glyceraldehyde-3-phosphate dehydrogenase n=1 Tax=Geothrix TaxID=44675 RepID=UPI001FAC1B01|nr:MULTISPECIES: type I glyceraldehyde-3-phosphate dehydrogenase [Geothrix]HJV39210.1 type I glyceraldehyde-3-phosphate dehydrogenase [Geothrix sp.]